MPTVHAPPPGGEGGTNSAYNAGEDEKSFASPSWVLPLALPSRFAGVSLVNQSFADPEEPSSVSTALPLGFGVPLPTPTTPPGTGIFVAGLGSLGCCGCACCSAFTVFCNNTKISGATVTISNSGGTVTSGTTDANGRVTLCYGTAGNYTVATTGTGHTDTSFTYRLACGQPVSLGVCLQACIYAFRCGGFSGLPGVDISITDSMGGAVSSGTTGPTGCALLPVPTNGPTCTATATYSGQTASESFTTLCGACGFFPSAAFGIFKAEILGCGGNPLPGATVTVDSTSQTTDSTGFIPGILLACGTNCVALTHTLSVTATDFQAVSGTFYTACGAAPNPYMILPCAVPLQLTPSAGFGCGCSGVPQKCVTPFPNTLTLVDSTYGTVTLTNSSGTVGHWFGQQTVNFPGFCCCAAKTVTIYYEFVLDPFSFGPPQCSLFITWGQSGHFMPFPACAVPDGPPFCPEGDDSGTVKGEQIPFTTFSCDPLMAAVSFGGNTCFRGFGGLPADGAGVYSPVGTNITITE